MRASLLIELGDWYNYSSLFGANLAWMAATTLFFALVLTAMQVVLSTEQFQGDAALQKAAVFAIWGPICAFGVTALAAPRKLINDLPLLLRGKHIYVMSEDIITARRNN